MTSEAELSLFERRQHESTNPDRRVDSLRRGGPDGEIKVVGVPSASNAGGNGREPSRYHVYRIERGANGWAGPRYSISVLARGYDPVTRRFVTKLDRDL